MTNASGSTGPYERGQQATSAPRESILAAMIQVAGSKGYGETAVADVIAESRTSRATFYKYFEDKHECFLAAYEMLVERLFRAVFARCDAEAPWLTRIATALATIVDCFAADPAMARTAVVEVNAAGMDARQLHLDAIRCFGEYLDAGREGPGVPETPEHVSLMAVGAVSGLIFDELIRGRAAGLPDLLPDLLFALLVPFVGPHVAAAEMRRVEADHCGT